MQVVNLDLAQLVRMIPAFQLALSEDLSLRDLEVETDRDTISVFGLFLAVEVGLTGSIKMVSPMGC